MALFANDATACFDRMNPAISSIVAMEYSMSPTVLNARNQVMENMEHSVRTRHGNSGQMYRQESRDYKLVLADKNQGKGDVTSLWSLKSQTILRAHQSMHRGISIPSVNGDNAIKNNDSFVDDTDAIAVLNCGLI